MDSLERFRWITAIERALPDDAPRGRTAVPPQLICRQTIWTHEDPVDRGPFAETLRGFIRRLRAIQLLSRAQRVERNWKPRTDARHDRPPRVAFVGRAAHLMTTHSGTDAPRFDRTLECVYRAAVDTLGEGNTLRFDFDSASNSLSVDNRWRVGDFCRALLAYARLEMDLRPILRTAWRKSPRSLTRNAFRQIRSLCIHNAASATIARAHWRVLLDREAPVSHLFIAAWYFPDAFGLIAAAHELDGVVIDVQHGQQGPIHGMYCGWNDLAAYEENIPDYFWLWNNYTADNIRRTSQPEIDSRIVVGGRCLPVNTDAVKADSLNVIAAGDYGDRAALIALQPANRDAKEPVPPQVLEYLSRLTPSVIIVKPHPAMEAAVLLSAIDALSGLPGPIDVRPAQEPLALTMRSAGLHLTSHSSSVFDAIHLRVPTVLWGDLAAEQFRSVLDAGIAWEIDDAPSSWESIAAAPIAGDLSYFEPEDLRATQQSAFRKVLGYSRDTGRADGNTDVLR